ncbi:hypothetical protein LPJ53_003370 [Coemansia erecta]|uniref:AB hydrolase-1 domain-containing protein n=1 Tax=Coemansia erecta TaxID=147472 RepID=A0A9W7XZF4_9FUNG|nr:hypothetical protein LPJ53_003370 [Coemansia erecta]
MQVTRRVFDSSRKEHKIVANIYTPTIPTNTQALPKNSKPVTLFLTHGTGFHKELWEPVLHQLFAHRSPAWTITSAVAIDMCSHGDSAVLNRATLADERRASWFTHARDVLRVLDQLHQEGGRRSFVGIGHSWGAGVLLLAESLSPMTFACLLPTEAVLFLRYMEDEKYCGMIERRKWLFADEQEARDYFTKHKLFKAWDQRCLELHIRHGLENNTTGEQGEGGVLALKCRPQSEAAVYRGADYASLYTTLRLWRVRCPTGFLVGRKSLQSPEAYVRKITEGMADRRLEVVEGAGHLLVLEKPDAAAEHYARFLDDMVPRSDARREIDFGRAKL